LLGSIGGCCFKHEISLKKGKIKRRFGSTRHNGRIGIGGSALAPDEQAEARREIGSI
jgi:hypothetical protein